MKNKSKKVMVSTETTPAMKVGFAIWWKREQFASESEALRYFIRTKTETLTDAEKKEASRQLR